MQPVRRRARSTPLSPSQPPSDPLKGVGGDPLDADPLGPPGMAKLRRTGSGLPPRSLEPVHSTTQTERTKSMPERKFYPSTADDNAASDHLRISWDRVGDDGAPRVDVAVGDRTLTIELDRPALNQMIRVLRRARDSQYGPDE